MQKSGTKSGFCTSVLTEIKVRFVKRLVCQLLKMYLRIGFQRCGTAQILRFAQVYTLAKACSKSEIKSTTSSIPTE
jgi:hypothetical protein